MKKTVYQTPEMLVVEIMTEAICTGESNPQEIVGGLSLPGFIEDPTEF